MPQFSGPYAEELDEAVDEGYSDEVIGSVDELGHYALFIDYTTTTGEMIHAILSTNSDGFVRSVLFDREWQVRAAWERLEQDYAKFDETALTID